MHLGKLYACLLSAPLFYQSPHPSIPNTDYKSLFNQAEKLSNAAITSGETDRQALADYLAVINLLSKAHQDDHFLFKAYVSTATFLQVLNRQQQSITYLKDAINLKQQLPDLQDSVLFRPLLYCGNAYYQTDKTDSAAMFYNRAEIIAEKYPALSELERLYNTLGVIAYSSGNYNQSITYYQKAISTLTSHKAYEVSFLVIYKNNLASAYKKLKRYSEALAIYQGLLAYHVQTDQLLHNIGSAYLAMGESRQAIKYLEQVKYTDQKKYNDLGRAYFEQKDYVNANSYLQKAADINTSTNRGHRNTDYGITLRYLGDLWFEKGQTQPALAWYQKSINNLLFDFSGTSIYDNPGKFTSVFNAMELLETMKAKALAFKKLYNESRKLKDLETSLQTYLAFYKLANYVERVYDNDESRLLITDKKYASHQQPIDICLQLFRLTGNRHYIEQAFGLDEQNKANILSLYLSEAKLKARSNIPPALQQQEMLLKRYITRLSLNVADEKDSTKLAALNHQLNEYSINLLKIQNKIDRETSFGRLKINDNGVSIPAIQAIIPANTTILSYHMLDTAVICFMMTNSKFDFFVAKIPADFYYSLKSLYAGAQQMEWANREQLKNLSQSFYTLLVTPAEKLIAGTNDLMIIPDGPLNYLPFEMLTNAGGDRLLNQHTITYNYSCTLLQNSPAKNLNLLSSIGLAPFADSTARESEFARLPASKTEIGSLKGSRLFGAQATKQEFLKDAPNFNIIHLATHAVADDHDPNRSFIAFYPQKADSAIDYKLFLPEIYNLKLDKTRLVVLSACESGTGELVNGEGLISLSRAFSYSGCDNIITSMWTADDVSTAYISGRLHFYLQKGNTIAYALQQAKLDYLNDGNIPATQKVPGYWAHLRLIGSFEGRRNDYRWLTWLAILLLAGFLIIKNRGSISKLISPRMK